MMATRSTSAAVNRNKGEAGTAGHAPALIINYSGRFGSRLENEVIFLPGANVAAAAAAVSISISPPARLRCLLPIVDEKSLLM
jgi:hypothetical protein